MSTKIPISSPLTPTSSAITCPITSIDDYIEDALMVDEVDFVARVPHGVFLCEPDMPAGEHAGVRTAPTFVVAEETADVIPPWSRGARTPSNEVSFVAPLLKRPGLPHADRFLIGRTETNDLVLPHASVSRAHGYVAIGAELLLYDAGSKHGTFVRDERLLPQKAYPLTTGRRIRFGLVRTMYLDASAFYRYCQVRPIADHASRTLEGR